MSTSASPIEHVFKSFNCYHCDTPYSKTANEPNAPTQTNCYDVQAICVKCYMEEKTTPPKSRSHRCNGWDCFRCETTPSYYLMKFLSSPFFGLDVTKNGYTSSLQSIVLPECPICLLKYSFEEHEKEPFGLWCGHSVCNGCFLKGMPATTDNWTAFPYRFTCPECRKVSCYTQKSWENPLTMFLRELKLKKSEKEVDLCRDCDECEKKGSLVEMFQCNDCQGKMLCSLCVCKKHYRHEVVDLEMEEIKKLTKETTQMITGQTKAYDVCFPELQSNLIKSINSFQKEILAEIHQMKDFNSYVVAERHQENCRSIGDEFEEICEKYLSELRLCNTGIEKLREKFESPQKDENNSAINSKDEKKK